MFSHSGYEWLWVAFNMMDSDDWSSSNTQWKAFLIVAAGYLEETCMYPDVHIRDQWNRIDSYGTHTPQPQDYSVRKSGSWRPQWSPWGWSYNRDYNKINYLEKDKYFDRRLRTKLWSRLLLRPGFAFRNTITNMIWVAFAIWKIPDFCMKTVNHTDSYWCS